MVVIAATGHLLEQVGERLQEGERTRLRRGEEQQAGVERIALYPGSVRGIRGVAARLDLQPRVAHRAQVKLHERQQPTALAVVQFEQSIRRERPRAPLGLEPLTRLAHEGSKMKAGRVRLCGQQRIHLGHARRVRQK